MVKVLFVGDTPSRLNLRTDVPFVGAGCFKRLVEWINYINPDYYICLNASQDMDKISDLVTYEGFKVIALGNAAMERLEDAHISALYLPHPSGRNRLLNDENAIANYLSAVTVAIRSKYEFDPKVSS